MLSRVLSALILSASLVCGVTACSRNSGGNEVGIDLAAMDTSVQPGNDFYAYANGAWQRTTEIPADRSSIGGSIGPFSRPSGRRLNWSAASSDPIRGAGTDEARIANFYNAYINTAAIDAAGMAPAQADLARFEAITNRSDLSRVLGEQVRADVDPLNATEFLHREPVRRVRHARPGDAGRSAPVRPSRRPRPAGARVLSLQRRGDGRNPRRVSRLYRTAPDARRRRRRRRQGAAHLQSGNADRPRPRDARPKRGLGQFGHGLEPRRVRATRAGNRLGRVPDRRTARQSAALRRLSRPGHHAAFGACSVASRCRPGRIGWRSTKSTPTPMCCRRQIDQAHFAFYGTTLSGTPQQRDRAKRGARRAQRRISATRSAAPM